MTISIRKRRCRLGTQEQTGKENLGGCFAHIRIHDKIPAFD